MLLNQRIKDTRHYLWRDGRDVENNLLSKVQMLLFFVSLDLPTSRLAKQPCRMKNKANDHCLANFWNHD